MRSVAEGRPRYTPRCISLSDHLPSGGGLEHLESGEDNLPVGFFQHPDEHLGLLDLIAHELAHAWNGRARTPADLWTPNFNVAMRDSLLWVYEGQTEFWSRVRTARAGIRTPSDTLDALAIDAAVVAARPGRAWKSLADSSLDPLSAIGQAVMWRDWQRREDYYHEGVLLWLDVEGLLRERTGGRRGLDDFARAFFRSSSQALGRPSLTYQLDDVCDALGQIASNDWRGYLRARLDSHSDAGVLDGLGRAGYRLVFQETRTVGARVPAVNGVPFHSDELEAAVQHAAATPVILTFQVDGETQEATVDRGTLRYPRLERLAGAPDGLAVLLRPRHAAMQHAKP